MNLPALMADDAPLALLTVTPDMQHIRWANQAAQEWLGLSLRRLDGKLLSDIFLDFGAMLEAGKRCQTALAPVSLIDHIVKRSGRSDQKSHVMIYPTAEHVGIIFQFIGSQPSEGRGGGEAATAMGRMLAHEIKNPLAGIDGAAQLLREDVSTDEGKGLIDLIRSEIDRIRRLADRMEKLGDYDPENVELINIHELLSKARRVMETGITGPEIKFRESYDPSLPFALGDPDSLLQAIINLIKNAAESIEQGGEAGEIFLETSFRRGVMRRGPRGQSEQQLPIEIRVQDTGPGVSDDVRNRLFQPFISDKPTGQGLGLALVSKVAAAHGGLVELQSRPGHTVFSILLPAPN